VDDELRDPVTALEFDGLLPVRVQQADGDLTAVAGIDGAGSIHHGDAVPGARPDRGWMSPTVPNGSATATPVGMSLRSPRGQGQGEASLIIAAV
jgi:hypothetical protein